MNEAFLVAKDTHWQPAAPLTAARKRADMLADIRRFFQQRNVLEVETPLLSRAAVSNPALASLQTTIGGQPHYLHTSPEFAMKRLLAAGWGDIYQICKVFRDGERGRRHNPEFTMLEWYRVGWNDRQLQDEVIELLQTLAGEPLGIERLTYADAFRDTLGIDPLRATPRTLAQLARQRRLAPDAHLPRDAWLDLLFSTKVAPSFPANRLTLITHYPASQAALARLHPDGHTAARFELFWGDLELANGYHELANPTEQRQRFQQDLQRRQAEGLPPTPLDQRFLAALDAGLPDCAGVALGLDRLLMKLLGVDAIEAVLAFPLDRA